MDSLLHSPLDLLLVGVAFLLVRRILPSGRHMLVAAQQDGMLFLLVPFLLVALLITLLVGG